MREKKNKKIKEQVQRIDESLANAETYIACNVNVKGTTFLHFGDWKGNSGHPAWMKNVMIPAWMRQRARKEKALETIDNRTKDKNISRRRRHGAICVV